MPLARQELADFTGTSLETCIRIMSRWQKDEVVLTGKDGSSSSIGTRWRSSPRRRVAR